jgi:hypothetical protein
MKKMIMPFLGTLMIFSTATAADLKVDDVADTVVREAIEQTALCHTQAKKSQITLKNDFSTVSVLAREATTKLGADSELAQDLKVKEQLVAIAAENCSVELN